MRTTDSIADSTAVAQLITAWQHTAEIHADSDLLAALTRDHDADYGLAPDPMNAA
ncbi:hypothetical protein AB0B50_39230 [Streptomyces sp. NPDC041068]|uniref:hypothetical protein n=1 Tax=Streptomyces sp. NPDC041068 TaxID=3155130 RepID=UPI0033FA3AC4